MTRVFFVYNTVNVPYGGANSFNGALKRTLSATADYGIKIVERPQDADVIFVNAATRGPHETLTVSLKKWSVQKSIQDSVLRPWHLKNIKSGRSIHHLAGLLGRTGAKKKTVVQRLDGVTRLYGRSDGKSFDELQVALNRQADFTVFQSTYCRDSFLPLIGPNLVSAVIPNGAEGDLFRWQQRKKPEGPIHILASSWSDNPKKGQSHLVALAKLPRVYVTYVGRWPSGVFSGDVSIVAPVSRTDLAERMKNFHLFAHLAENDPAPNCVMEAMAVGMPVLYRNSGGTPELVEGEAYGEGINEVSQESLSNAMEKLMNRYDILIEKIHSRRESFLIERAAEAYSCVFHGAAQKPDLCSN